MKKINKNKEVKKQEKKEKIESEVFTDIMKNDIIKLQNNKKQGAHKMSKIQQFKEKEAKIQNKVRLENEKKIWIAELTGNEYTIISGSKASVLTRKGFKILDGNKKYSPEQLALKTVARMVEVHLKNGYAPVNRAGEEDPKSIEQLMERVKAELNTTTKIVRYKNQKERLQARVNKIEERIKAMNEKHEARIAKLVERVTAINEKVAAVDEKMA